MTEPQSASGMMVLIDKMMGQLQLMRKKLHRSMVPLADHHSVLHNLIKSHLLSIMNALTYHGIHIHLSMLLTELMGHLTESREATSLHLY